MQVKEKAKKNWVKKSVYFKEDINKFLAATAGKENRSYSNMIEHIVRSYMDKTI